MKETAQLLREKGLKVTPQRIAVYNMLLGTTAHPNAEMIYKTLEPTNPTMSLSIKRLIFSSSLVWCRN